MSTMTKEKKQSALKKPVQISPELAAIVGHGPMPRTEITKKLWVYIKQHRLQVPTDKRTIQPDAKLAAVIGQSPINMFKMTGKVSKHIKN